MRVIYADLPSSVRVVVIDADTVVITARWREILAPYEPRWTPATFAAALGLNLDDLAHARPAETQTKIGALSA